MQGYVSICSALSIFFSSYLSSLFSFLFFSLLFFSFLFSLLSLLSLSSCMFDFFLFSHLFSFSLKTPFSLLGFRSTFIRSPSSSFDQLPMFDHAPPATDCRVVKRRKRLFVTCKRNPRHKQRQGFHTSTTVNASPSFELLPSTTLPNLSLATPLTNQAVLQELGAFSYLSAFR